MATDDSPETALRKRFGDSVRREREAKGWTQEQFAEVVHMSQQWVGKIEKAKIGIKLADAARVADALEAPLGDLLGLPGFATANANELHARRANLAELFKRSTKDYHDARERVAVLRSQLDQAETARSTADRQRHTARMQIEDLSDALGEYAFADVETGDVEFSRKDH